MILATREQSLRWTVGAPADVAHRTSDMNHHFDRAVDLIVFPVVIEFGGIQ